ncbi:transposase [Aquibium oceanicum]
MAQGQRGQPASGDGAGGRPDCRICARCLHERRTTVHIHTPFRRTTRLGGYVTTQRVRKRIEEAFGWIKTVAGQDKTKFRGCNRVGWAFIFAAAAYNLVRLPKLVTETG